MERLSRLFSSKLSLWKDVLLLNEEPVLRLLHYFATQIRLRSRLSYRSALPTLPDNPHYHRPILDWHTKTEWRPQSLLSKQAVSTY